MISPAAAELIVRCREQVRSGIACVLRNEIVLAQVWFRSANASLGALYALLDEPAPPLRRLVVVGPREEEAEPEWFARKAGDPDGRP